MQPTSPAHDTVWEDTAAEPGKRFQYRVVAWNSLGSSEPSEESDEVRAPQECAGIRCAGPRVCAPAPSRRSTPGLAWAGAEAWAIPRGTMAEGAHLTSFRARAGRLGGWGVAGVTVAVLLAGCLLRGPSGAGHETSPAEPEGGKPRKWANGRSAPSALHAEARSAGDSEEVDSGRKTGGTGGPGGSGGSGALGLSSREQGAPPSPPKPQPKVRALRAAPSARTLGRAVLPLCAPGWP